MLKGLLSFLCWGLVLSSAVWASESAWPVRKGGLYLEIQPQWEAWSHGEPAPVQALSALTRLEYGYLESAALALELPFQSLTRNAVNGLSNAFSAQSTANGFSDLWLGHYLQLLQDPLTLSLRTGLTVPLGYPLNIRPILGEGQLNLDLALLAGYQLQPWPAFVQASTGYRLRGAYNRQHLRVQEALQAGQTLTKPADQIIASCEAGYWLHPALLLSLRLDGDFALNQSESLRQSRLQFSPLLAWRIQPEADLSLHAIQTLWSQNSPFLSGLSLGLHLRFGDTQHKNTGLRGSESSALPRQL